ncbi:acetoacetate--CoA ligase [Candidatus Puniceispirillum marinum]|uniref:Acetyl-coenzyme A synthetase n=1 Tax=Puniceispirillum marinum (strain IMCC1322) TaxID=488538 RepID=D5BRN1_PUNMI|nr:acetoacetate--CoA ligase [Candidatus Puniceispirillum marinum]ADE38928.1 acetyl-coenzyme A synthetase [Candidatus Puniceispirillum marinum IMCC1322]
MMPTLSTSHDQLLWRPDQAFLEDAEISKFIAYLTQNNAYDGDQDFQKLWQWSIDNSEQFWSALWDWHGVIGRKGDRVLIDAGQMPGAKFFPDAKINFAENMIRDADDTIAISAYGEDGRHQRLTRQELYDNVMSLAGWLQQAGVKKGDRVAAYAPNVPETIIMMLASATIGAVFSSCSPDFGLDGVRDRFGQIEPKILLACDGYHYAGKHIDRLPIIADLVATVSSVSKILIIPYLNETPDLSGLANATLFAEALGTTPVTDFTQIAFNDPLYILYSSGTTGAPKCIVHGTGGTMLQHIKEHRLHSNVKAGDNVFYFTTCGWMMWNWLVSALMMKATIVLYEGNPFFPGPERLWQIAETEKLSLFGTSAKYIDAVSNAGYHPRQSVDLSALRSLLSTGSPLSSDGFDFVYKSIKDNVQLCSISGGTDIVSCFVLGAPSQPVYAGEIQTRGLGMAVDVLDDDGMPVRGKQGELCCCAPFPSMPVMFWNDPDESKYKAAYFEHFPGLWRHGDWATLNERGGIVIHGRSDATLNPGGVRIGTAEIYRQVEAFPEVIEALVIGQNWDNDVRVILFVKMADGCALSDKIKADLKAAIRKGATPRHVPAVIAAVPDIPRTRSGKITELAVRDIIHGRDVKNTSALANAEALDFFKHIAELKS